jgi:hypothetical protein
VAAYLKNFPKAILTFRKEMRPHVASRGDVHGLRVLEKPYRTADLAGALRDALDGDRASVQ